jgi:hypothetical protein
MRLEKVALVKVLDAFEVLGMIGRRHAAILTDRAE